MENRQTFLNHWGQEIQKMQLMETGNFITALKNQIEQPEVNFLHLLCRKIDIKHEIFTDYDKDHDLKHTSDRPLDDHGWFDVLYLLAYWLFASEDPGIQYKALNTLLKAEALISQDLKNLPCIQELYHNFIPQWL